MIICLSLLVWPAYYGLRGAADYARVGTANYIASIIS